jgi:16S rRNA processing protein RimM
MQKSGCFYAGKIVRKHSFKGEVIIKIDKDTPEIIKELESVFVDLNGNLVPFFIEKSAWQKTLQLRVKFEDINSEADADAIVNSEIFLSKELLPELEGNAFYKAEIIGFKVEDVHRGVVGIVKGVNEKTPQTLLEVIDENDNLVLIPAIDAFIQKIDRDNKIIFVETPEGLLDLHI